MTTDDTLLQLVHDLSEACGLTMALIKESVGREQGGYITATARSWEHAQGTQQVCMNALARVLISPNDAGGSDTWALVFFYMNNVRVAPVGSSYMKFRLNGNAEVGPRWIGCGWEADIYDEWGELERLEGAATTAGTGGL